MLSQSVTALALRWSLHRVREFLSSKLFSSSAAEVGIVAVGGTIAGGTVAEVVAVELCLLQSRQLQPSRKSLCVGHLHRQ